LIVTYIVEGFVASIAREPTRKESGRPEVFGLQVVPPSVVLKMASSEAAYTVEVLCGSMAKALAEARGKPVLLQLWVPSVLLTTVPWATA
jgi:hypothetical protein